MRGDIRRMFLAAAGLSVCAALIAVSCGPLGDDDDNPDGDNDIVMSTYTPTIPGSTPEAVKTRDAAQTAAVMTATEEAVNPPPSTAIAGDPEGDNGTPAPAGTSDGSSSTSQPPIGGDDNPLEPDLPNSVLQPPSSALVAGDNQIDGALGPYAWQWDDPDQTYFEVPAIPLMQISDVALTIPAGSEAEIVFAGDALKAPPASITLDVFDFDENTANPVDQSGNVIGEGLAFAPKVAPVTTLQPDPENPTFTADFAPGHYILRLRADWPPPANPTKPGGTVFVTYTFNIIVE